MKLPKTVILRVFSHDSRTPLSHSEHFLFFPYKETLPNKGKNQFFANIQTYYKMADDLSTLSKIQPIN